MANMSQILANCARCNQVCVGFLTLIVFCLHINNKTHPLNYQTTDGGESQSWCKKADDPKMQLEYQCIGDSLRWYMEDADSEAIADWNFMWRTVFTFNIGFLGDGTPVGFIDVWTPFIFSMLALAPHCGVRIKAIDATWWRCFIFYVVLALFANYGYAGNFGILLGFITAPGLTILLAVCALVCPEEQTNFNNVLEFCNKTTEEQNGGKDSDMTINESNKQIGNLNTSEITIDEQYDSDSNSKETNGKNSGSTIRPRFE